MGKVSKVIDPSLARSTAANRARVELAKLIRRWIIRQIPKSEQDNNFRYDLDSFVAAKMNGVVVDEYWYYKRRKRLYALVKVDVDSAELTQEYMKSR